MKKKTFLVFLMILFIVLLFALPVNAYKKEIILTEKSGKLVDGFSYVIDDKARTITINGKGKLTNNYNYNYEWKNFDYKLHYTLVFGNGITEIDCTFDILPHLVTSTYLGRDIKKIDKILYCTQTWWEPYEVDPDNQYFSNYNGCLYTKDFSKLLYYPYDKAPNDFHPNLNEIGKFAFADYKFNGGDTLIIPWGVTKIGDNILSESENGYYVIPDTAINLGDVTGESGGGFHFNPPTFSYWIPSRNNISAYNKWHPLLAYESWERGLPMMGDSDLGKEWLEKYEKAKITDIPADNIAKYYGIKPNSLKTFQNGKTYYFDSNYKMATGWKKVNGTWYYFNDYGAAVVKIWLKSGNKWYYMQEDGTMATNKWIKWYNKWYYVGKDGAMYANRKTPDGYYVNASGVWVK